ncbi:MAG: Fe2+-dependent dioxygenase [Hahellaceae bacterium]|nr:Fe2+-dependent dioxygenase [Hahellaceae bacterium]MCP5169806.1 Fe2+-dependent dioxygenase [Hahellaceae bacterium]
MIISIQEVFTQSEVAQILALMEEAEWVDGKVTAGAQATGVKQNQQLAENSPLSRQLGERIFQALSQHPVFISAALPLKIYPPMFNRYRQGETYGLHVDNAMRVVPGTLTRVRTDLSATLFLSEPASYEGGELCIEDHYGTHSIRLDAGDMILYPSTSRHQVMPVTSGARICSFFWIQSMVRNNDQREMLFDLDQSVQSLTQQHGYQHADVIRLSGLYQNLIRQWADT